MKTKYCFDIPKEVILSDRKRLINQLWKVLPMKENNEDWEKQLQSVINEISGLNRIFVNNINFLILLSKLESLYLIKNFIDFRRTIFESINILGEILNE